MSIVIYRRVFLSVVASAIAVPREGLSATTLDRDLAGAVGVTTGSFSKHMSVERAEGKLRMLDLPRIMRDELGMRVIDLMTATLPSLEPAYCDEFRAAAERAKCVVTNLKMNQKGLDMASADAALRNHSLETYRATIDAAERLGCRWVRPASTANRPDLQRLADGFRTLIDYAAPKGISLLIENNGWLSDDPQGIPRVIEMVGAGLAAQPDTGNWTAEARYEGLQKAFPLAASCDFKAFELGPHGEHANYDLHRCFEIGWGAGFRGPWCFEHFNKDLKQLLKEMVQLREILERWMQET